ncbi:MAG: BTAD domain-containing putative transcriptional regulator [Chloroflexi bacterium]|nr:BTAD domain-containing putative transcriptional regulator [Chloroflexota bacterium]
MAGPLELALLGPPQLHQAGQPLGRFRSAKTYALLYYLAVTRRPQPRTVLAGLFWGDVDEYYARRNFNRTLSDLAHFVGAHLVIERQTVALALHQPYWLDVALLETAAATAPTAQTIAALATAAALYRGEFLEGFYVQEAPAFEQWVLNERTRLQTCVLHLLGTLAQFAADQGDLPQALAYARRLLHLAPWREETHRQVMIWLAQSGQRSAALAQYEHCRQVLRRELDVEPDAATLELVARIRADSFDQKQGRQGEGETGRGGDRERGVAEGNVKFTTSLSLTSASSVEPSPRLPVSPSPLIPHNLPGQRTPFIGREAELADIIRLLVEEDDCYLLTLIGPGGMGKTRLVLKAAEQIVAMSASRQRFTDGLFFIPLENVSDAKGLISAVISAIARESGFSLHSEAPLLEQLAHFLHTKAMLLVLDNFEHLIEHAELCSTLLTAAPQVKIVVTSREALSLQEAWFYPLPGLTFPQTPAEQETPEAYDAVRLFVQCARRTQPAFVFAAERSAVLRICTLVEGMPLGIELAAAWLKAMTCEQIAQEVARGLDFLTTRYQNMPARHRSMRVVLEHSWRLLSTGEQATIARLSIFRGKFRQEAATHITGTSLFTLATLVEKALLRVTTDGYYQLHELTRQFAEQQISHTDSVALRDVHATYYASLLNQQRAHLFTGNHRQVWAIVGGELDNIRHAWEWLVESVSPERHDLPVTQLLYQMARVFAHYYIFHSLTLSGQAIFATACQAVEAAGWAEKDDTTSGQPSPPAIWIHLRLLTGLFHFERGHYRDSLAVAEQTLAACQALGLTEDLLQALLLYGRTQMRRGAHAESAEALQTALALGKRLGVRPACAEALTYLGMVANNEGQYLEAQGYLRQGLALWQEIGYRPWVARTLTSLGTSYIRQYDYQRALPFYEQALAIAQEEADQTMIMINTSNLGSVQYGFRHYPLSVDYYQQSLVMARKVGEERWIAANLNGLALTYLAMGDLTATERDLREALTVGQQSGSLPDVLGSVGLLGHLFARRGQVEAALKALIFVEQHPASMARDKVYNQPLLAELRSELPPALWEQAATWADGQSLDDVVQWLRQGENTLSLLI